MNLLFTFPDNSTIDSPFILEGAKITECFYNELKSADNSASVRIPFNETLCDKIKANISKNIKVQIKNNNTNLFTGYTRKTISFSKTQRNQPFSLEIVSPAILLDYTYTGTTIHYSNTTLGNVVIALLSLSPFGMNIDVTKIENKQLLFFKLEDGANIKNILNELLFEYGYCYDFDGNGNFYITEMFPSVPTSPTQKFNGDNCLNEINQQVKEDKYNRVSVEWNKIQQHNNVLIFEDTTGADSNHKANININATSYYLDTELNYLEYDSKYQSVVWIDSAALDISFDSENDITKTFSNLGEKAELSIYNAGSSARTITGLSVTGNGYFEISTNFAKSGTSGKEISLKAEYIQNDSDAAYLSKKLCDYYNYSNFSTSVYSKTKYEVGTYVELSDTGIGTVIYRIVKRIYDLYKNAYSYSLESVTEYEPVETYTKGQNVKTKGDNGETLRTSIDDLNKKVDGIVTSATMCSADLLSAIIKLDNDGKTIAAQDITTTISLKQSDVDLDFSIGAINLPSGWTYTINGNKIVFHIAEGVSLRSGQFAIPVLYKPVVSEDFFVDENDEIFVDENNVPFVSQTLAGSYTQWNLYFTFLCDNGGVYLGLIKSLASIPSSNNYGDYFTWGGADTVSSLAYEGKFLTARVYKYVGEGKAYKWQQDTNAEHGQAALSDVLDVANADLKKNNSTVYMYLDHLTANTIYADMIVANDAFINKITSKVVSIGELATIGTVDSKVAQGEINAMDKTLQDLGVSTLKNHTIISGGKIVSDLINASLIAIGDLEGFTDIKSLIDSKASQSALNSLSNTVDGKASSTSVTDIVNGVTAIQLKNALLNGQTLIYNGYIRTDFIDTNNITISSLKDGDSVLADIQSKASKSALNNVIDGKTAIDMKNALCNGKTVISGGLIDSYFINVNTLKAKTGLFDNITVNGLIQQGLKTFNLFQLFMCYNNNLIKIISSTLNPTNVLYSTNYTTSNEITIQRIDKGIYKFRLNKAKLIEKFPIVWADSTVWSHIQLGIDVRLACDRLIYKELQEGNDIWLADTKYSFDVSIKKSANSNNYFYFTDNTYEEAVYEPIRTDLFWHSVPTSSWVLVDGWYEFYLLCHDRNEDNFVDAVGGLDFTLTGYFY